MVSSFAAAIFMHLIYLTIYDSSDAKDCAVDSILRQTNHLCLLRSLQLYLI